MRTPRSIWPCSKTPRSKEVTAVGQIGGGGMKQAKGRSQGMRSPEVVWALNLLWIGLGNYYGSGFTKPLWLLASAALYAIYCFPAFGRHPIDPWLVGYALLFVVGPL